MAVPASPTISAAANIAINTAFLGVLDGAATAAQLKIRDAAGALLAPIALSDPAGTVDGTTGQLTLGITAGTWSANGTAAYGEFCDGDGSVHLSLPCKSGNAAESGYIVINSLTAWSGEPVQKVSAVIG